MPISVVLASVTFLTSIFFQRFVKALDAIALLLIGLVTDCLQKFIGSVKSIEGEAEPKVFCFDEDLKFDM